jgi:hypothetical protein
VEEEVVQVEAEGLLGVPARRRAPGGQQPFALVHASGQDETCAFFFRA